MNILTIHPANADQETAIRIFLDALHVEYNAGSEVDETAYLMSSPNMIKHLDTAIEQDNNLEGKKISLDEIWK